MLEELVHHRYELPGFSTLDRLAIQAREKIHDVHFASISDHLDAKVKALIDGLFKVKQGETSSTWNLLKREPKKPTNKETRSYLQHIRRLQLLVDQLPTPDIPVPKLKQYRYIARSLDATEMAELKPQKRYALAVIYIRSQFAQTLDDAADLFVRMLQNLDNQARNKLGEYQQSLKTALLETAEAIDAEFPENAFAEIVDGRLILKKPPASEPPPGIRAIDQLITVHMENISIVDVLIDTERWLQLHKLFRPLMGTESRIEELRPRVISTLFCYGCNLGPTQTARSIRGMSRKQIAWLNIKYVTEEVLEKAIVKVINAYNKFELPGYWGSGKHASADGTKWNLYEQNLISEHHIRYGGYGGTCRLLGK